MQQEEADGERLPSDASFMADLQGIGCEVEEREATAWGADDGTVVEEREATAWGADDDTVV